MSGHSSGNIEQGSKQLSNIENWVASYLGNGLLGGCFDYAGLQFQDGTEGRPDIIGDTYFVSQSHYVHGRYGMDYALPIGRLQADIAHNGKTVELSNHTTLTKLSQSLDIRKGILQTRYSLRGGPTVKQTQFFSQVRKHVFAAKVESEADIRFRFVPITQTPYHYGSHFETEVKTQALEGCTVHEIPTNLQTTAVALKQSDDLVLVSVYSSLETDNPAQACIDDISSAVDAGSHTLLAEQQAWWNQYWDESDVSIPHPLDSIWKRANYYIGCSCADQKTHPPLVFGLARVQWPAYFPQDYFYAYTNTFAANHLKQAAGTSEFWFEILRHAEDYAKRVFGLDGAVYPWTPTVFDWHDYHRNARVPNSCYYELHNSAYVAKMCHDYYLHTCDESYLREKAYPVIKQIARMYASMTTIIDGRAQIRFKPNTSQDEGSPTGMPNYFDTLVSAEFTLRLAGQLAERFGDSATSQMCSKILDAGYAYERLEFEDTYSVFEGDVRTEDFQKHPVQLNPITWLPIQRFFEDPRIRAYHARRYDICRGYKDASSTAWTLGQFMLASCRLRMPDELAKDIENIQRCRIMDPAYTQTFESTRRSPHFLTTIGLFMQAITETLVQTHNGFTEIFPCLLKDQDSQPIEFRGIRAPGGFRVSGLRKKRLQRLEITSEFGGVFEFGIHGEERHVVLVDDQGNEVYAGPASRGSFKTTPGAVYTLSPTR